MGQERTRKGPGQGQTRAKIRKQNRTGQDKTRQDKTRQDKEKTRTRLDKRPESTRPKRKYQIPMNKDNKTQYQRPKT